MPAYTNADMVEVIKRYDRLVQRRATWDQSWEQIARLIRPLRVDIRSHRSPGAMQTQAVFDGTAIKAASDLASAIQGSLYPVEMQWFRLVMAYKPLNDLYPVQLWLQEVESRLNLAFQQSNLQGEGFEMMQDLVVFGTGCLLIEEKPSTTGGFGGFRFRAIAPGRYCLMEGPEGRVEHLYRLFTMTAQALQARFGDQVSEKTSRLARERPEEPIQVLHVVRPALRTGPRRLFESLYVEYETKHLLAQHSMRMFRFLVPRWSKTADEEYGRGQGHLAYPDVASLNRAVEMRFKQWAKALDPPIFTTDDGVITKPRLTPGSRNVARNRDSIWTLDMSGVRFDVNQFQEEQIRAQIRATFYADKLQLPAKQYMTAYEIQQQVEIMQRELGPTIGRVKAEFLTPLIENAFDIMLYAGALPAPPPEVIEAVGLGLGMIDVQYESPLTRAQRTSELVALSRTIEAVAPLVPANPEILDNLDPDQVIRGMAEASGLPTRFLRPVELVQAVRQARVQAIAQQQQAALAKDQSTAAKNYASAAERVAAAEGPPPPGPFQGRAGAPPPA